MAVGDIWVRANGYTFQETLHGPMDWGTCVDCGAPALEAMCNLGRVIPGVPLTRCGKCARKHWGLGLV